MVWASLWLVGCAPLDPGHLLVLDETNKLPRESLQVAADPLLQRGVDVVVLLVGSGDSQDLSRRLRDGGHWQNGDLAARSVCVYVSLRPRYSEIRAGSRWSSLLSGSSLEIVRSGALNPSLRTGDFERAVAASLEQVSRQMDRSLENQRRWRAGLFSLVLAGLALWSGLRMVLLSSDRAGGCRGRLRSLIAELERLSTRRPDWAHRLAELRPRWQAGSLEELQAAVAEAVEMRDGWRDRLGAESSCETRQQEVRQLLQEAARSEPGLPLEEWRERLESLGEDVTASAEVATLRRTGRDYRALYSEISQAWKERSPRSWERRFENLTCASAPAAGAPDTPPASSPASAVEWELPRDPERSSGAGGDW